MLILHRQTLTTIGVSGNASVVNVAGDHVTHINDGLGVDTYAVLESIEECLKAVQDKELGTLSFAFSMALSNYVYAAPDKMIRVWLSAPDVSQNLNAALRRREVGTGAWFLEGAQFTEWKENPNIVLCIFDARELPYCYFMS